jgi:hypothetical protein
MNRELLSFLLELEENMIEQVYLIVYKETRLAFCKVIWSRERTRLVVTSVIYVLYDSDCFVLCVYYS